MGSYRISVDPKPNERVLMRDRKGHIETQGGNRVNKEAELELCPHKPVNARSHQRLEEAKPQNLWREWVLLTP